MKTNLAACLLRLASALWLTTGCAATGERAGVRAPTSPEAEESPARAIATSLTQDPLAEGTSEPGPHPHAHSGAAQPAQYTCPMHPEIVQPEPGSCPKCGMQLVPLAPADKPSQQSPATQGAPAPAPETQHVH